MSSFNGLGMHLGNLSRLSKAQTRSISAENFKGEKGKGAMATEGVTAHAAGDLGQGWKISPCVRIEPGETFEVASIDGPGAIQHIWMTPTGNWRLSIIRIYWDGSDVPSVEAPVGDFFASGWGEFAQVSSLAVCVNPGSAFNCYWEMPFRKHCRITLTNIAEEQMTLFYQVNYTLTEVPDDVAYFHAHFRRTNPIPYKQDYEVVDGIEGTGQFVGMYLAWGTNNNGWWGEGEVKFFMDGDEHPTVCTTGLEDYFCGSYNFDPTPKHDNAYVTYTTPYAGFHQVIRPSSDYRTQFRMGMYRWHVIVKRRRRLTPDRLAILTPDGDELIRPGEAGRGCTAGSDQRDGVQARFLKCQLSLPVSTMSQWWVSRSRSAVVFLASPKTVGHSPKARLVVTMTEVCS